MMSKKTLASEKKELLQQTLAARIVLLLQYKISPHDIQCHDRTGKRLSFL
jgi:hypothetical protein